MACTGGHDFTALGGNTGQIFCKKCGTSKDLSITWSGHIVKGMIMMWSGAIDKIPSGWRLCDGTNGTPDLRDKFVAGAGSEYPVKSVGGRRSLIYQHTSTHVWTR